MALSGPPIFLFADGLNFVKNVRVNGLHTWLVTLRKEIFSRSINVETTTKKQPPDLTDYVKNIDCMVCINLPFQR